MISKAATIDFLVLLLITCLNSCLFDADDHKLKLYNNSEKLFYNLVKKDTNIELKEVEFYTEKFVNDICYLRDTVCPVFARINQGGYVRKINKEGLDSSLYLYLFEIDSVQKYGWNTVVDKRIYFRSKYNVKQLDSINWLIHLDKIVSSKRKPF